MIQCALNQFASLMNNGWEPKTNS